MKKVLLSIIILNYNTPEVTFKCIRSFMSQKDVNFEIIFIENSDKVDAKQEMKKILEEWWILKNNNFKYIDVWYNSWFAGWNNIWWEKAQWQYILMLNSDVWVEDDYFLKKFLEEFRKLDKNVVAASPKQVWGDGFAKYRKKGYYLHKNFMEGIVALKRKPKIKKDKSWNSYWCLFACLLIDKEKIKDLLSIKWLKIPFDNKYFIYNEDMYLLFIFDLFGYKYVHLKREDLSFNHIGSYSGNKVNKLKIFHWEKNRVMNILLFYSLKSQIFLLPVLILTCIWRLVLEFKNFKILLLSYVWIIKNIVYILEQRNIIQKNRKNNDKILLENRVPEMFHEYSKLNLFNYIFKVWFKLLDWMYEIKR